MFGLPRENPLADRIFVENSKSNIIFRQELPVFTIKSLFLGEFDFIAVFLSEHSILCSV